MAVVIAVADLDRVVVRVDLGGAHLVRRAGGELRAAVVEDVLEAEGEDAPLARSVVVGNARCRF